MKAKDIVIGEYYKHRTSSKPFAKAIKILNPRQDENTNNYVVVKCEWVMSKDDKCGFIKYFRPMDLVKIKGAF